MLTAKIKAFIHDDGGATAIEYGLIAGLVAVVCISSFVFFGKEVLRLFDNGAAELLEAQTAKIN
jgi:pilus assembly protein Flp/PilA